MTGWLVGAPFFHCREEDEDTPSGRWARKARHWAGK